MNGIHEVRGSIPLVSTNIINELGAPTRCPYLFIWRPGTSHTAGAAPARAAAETTRPRYRPMAKFAGIRVSNKINDENTARVTREA